MVIPMDTALKAHLTLISLCLLITGCGSGSNGNPTTSGLAADDGPTDLAGQLINRDGMQWQCEGLFDGSAWSAAIRLEENHTAVYTFASGEALMATWTLDTDSRDIEWDLDFDGQIDRTATLQAPILNLATDSFHNIRETFTQVALSDARALSITRVRERDSALLEGQLNCVERP
jgi:hypothetical protein